jgi:hypothetical protein
MKPRPKKSRRQFIVSIDMPEGCTATDVAKYIRSAVRMWAKGGDPEDPIWQASETATVRPVVTVSVAVAVADPVTTIPVTISADDLDSK